jgi:hypothetical protein
LPAKLWFLTLPSGRVKTKASQAKAQKGKNQKVHRVKTKKLRRARGRGEGQVVASFGALAKKAQIWYNIVNNFQL